MLINKTHITSNIYNALPEANNQRHRQRVPCLCLASSSRHLLKPHSKIMCDVITGVTIISHNIAWKQGSVVRLVSILTVSQLE